MSNLSEIEASKKLVGQFSDLPGICNGVPVPCSLFIVLAIQALLTLVIHLCKIKFRPFLLSYWQRSAISHFEHRDP